MENRLIVNEDQHFKQFEFVLTCFDKYKVYYNNVVRFFVIQIFLKHRG